MKTLKNFVNAFNAGDLDALAACVAEDAWAEVVDAPFPREEGRDKIRATSFAYLLGESLTAEMGEVEVLLRDSDGVVDMAVRFEEKDGLATVIRYFTRAHGHTP